MHVRNLITLILITTAVVVKTEEQPDHTCKEKIKNANNSTTTLFINGMSSEEILDEDWANFIKHQDNIKKVYINNCKIKPEDTLSEIEFFFNLEVLKLTNLNISCFNLHYIDNNPRLTYLNLDNNPISELQGDAQIELKHLSLLNTSLTRTLLDSNKSIMKHLISFNISGDFNHDEVCSRYESLQMFNGKPCMGNQGKSVPKTSQPREEPSVKKEQQESSSSFHLQPTNLIVLLISASTLFMANVSKRYICLIVIAMVFQQTTAALFDPKDVVDNAELNLTGHGISSFEVDELSSLPMLTHLYLSDNKLTRLNINSKSLTHLYVTNNHIQDVESDDFLGLPHLRKLFLDGNKLKAVDWDLNWKTEEITKIDLSHNLNLRSVRIQSKSLEFLMLTGNTIDKMELDTPALKLIDLRNAYYSDGGFEDICKRHSRFNFRISYVIEENGLTEFHECTNVTKDLVRSVDVMARSPQVDEYQMEEVKEMKSIGCEFSTLKIKSDDVVLSLETYNQLNIIFVLLCSCVFVLCGLLIWVTRMYYNLHNEEYKYVKSGVCPA